MNYEEHLKLTVTDRHKEIQTPAKYANEIHNQKWINQFHTFQDQNYLKTYFKWQL